MAQHNQEQQLQATISFPTIDISDDSNLPPEPDCPPSCYTANVSNALKAAEDGEGTDDFEEQESQKRPCPLHHQRRTVVSREQRLRKLLREQGVPVLPLPSAAAPASSTAPTKAHHLHIRNHQKFDTLKSFRGCSQCKICTQLEHDNDDGIGVNTQL